jgi:thimet oligopeptidase
MVFNMIVIKMLPALGLLFVLGCATARSVGRSSTSPWALEATPLERSAAEFNNDAAEHLAWAKAYRSRIVEADGPRTIENTLVPYNQMMMHLDAASSESNLFARVHPDAQVRAAAEESERAVAKYVTELNLDRQLYEAFRDLDVSRGDAGTRYVVEKRLRDFRRAGVDKSEDVRKRVAALNEEMVKLGQDFAKNTREDEREIVLDSPSDLEGLPQDWIDKHRPGADGKIKVSTRTPDYIPFATYAHNAAARSKLYREFKDRGYPKNVEVLQGLLRKRYELAQTLGYANWAEYITEDKMIGTAGNAKSFIDKIAEAGKAAVERDYNLLLERKRKDISGAAKVEDWEKSYYEELVKSEQYAFDSQSLRPYFNFPDVQRGLFDLTGKLFGVTYRQVEGLKLWHPSVTAWDIYDSSKCIGRFYLDLFPRENKYGHAAQFDYRTGVGGIRLPQAVLVCNFPNPNESTDGVALMEHSEVVTFFHEFGHLLHALFAGRQPWIGNSGISTEWDFVEAPSQILEEWCYNLDSLRVFAKHHQTGEPIPAELVTKLRRARDFGKGLYAAHQMFYAAVSLNYYNRSPEGLDTTKLLMELQEKYSPFDYVEGTHFQCSFGHLDGYSAIYYTYMWSLVIAKDLLSKFEQDGMLNAKTARQYRETILEPGGSKKATELVQDFLGRPYSFEAFEKWLNRS